MLKAEDVADWLKHASYEELLAVLGPAMEQQLARHQDQVGVSVLTLALAYREEGEPWEISLAARGSERFYGAKASSPRFGEPWCQFGDCAQCGLELVGALKTVVCPCCGAEAYLT